MNIEFDEEENSYRACPHCTIQIPADESTCPHCELPTAPVSQAKEAEAQEGYHESHSRVKKKRSPFLLLLILVLSALIVSYGGSGLYNKLFGIKIVIRDNPDLLIGGVDVDVVSKKRVLTGTVLNNLQDVPVISLQSIRVKAEVVMEDGKVVTKTRFPVGPLSEPGALLIGDSGFFKIDLPRKNVNEVRLGAELIDLGGKKRFYAPASGSRSR